MAKEKFIPRKFEALLTEKGLDDGGDFTFVFEVTQLKKGKIYYESNPEYLTKPYNKNVVIDDNGCWNHIGSGDFWKKFKEVQ